MTLTLLFKKATTEGGDATTEKNRFNESKLSIMSLLNSTSTGSLPDSSAPVEPLDELLLLESP